MAGLLGPRLRDEERLKLRELPGDRGEELVGRLDRGGLARCGLRGRDGAADLGRDAGLTLGDLVLHLHGLLQGQRIVLRQVASEAWVVARLAPGMVEG